MYERGADTNASYTPCQFSVKDEYMMADVRRNPSNARTAWLEAFSPPMASGARCLRHFGRNGRAAIDAAANDSTLVSFVEKARPAAIPNSRAHFPCLAFASADVCGMKYPVPAQNIIMVKQARSISWMKSVAKNTNIGAVASRAANAMPTDAFRAILRTAENPRRTVIAAKNRGVHLSSVASSVAVELLPAAFWIAAAA